MSDTEEGSSPRSLVLHVLCPSVPAPNRFTFRNLPLSTTVADLKVRLSRSIQSHPNSDSQRLFYLGKPLLDDGATLQSVFEPLNGSEFSMHLVLPPSQLQPTNSAAPTPDRSPFSSIRTNLARHNTQLNSGHSVQQLEYRARYRSTNPLNQSDIPQVLQESARRRLMELNQRSGVPQTRNQEATMSAAWSSSRQFTRRASHDSGPFGSGTSTTTPLAAPSNPLCLASEDGLQLPDDVQPRLRLLKQYISLAEEQLNCGIAPSIDHISELRTHLFRLLDDQLKQPLSERGEFVEPLITRVFDISSRADHLRQPRLLTVHPGPSASAPLYLLSSPGGYQAVVASSVTADAVRAPDSPQSRGMTGPVNALPPNAQPNADAVVMENVVRQAVLNQRPAVDGQLDLGRNLRRLWLFVRLYFFCYMFSAPGTWTRIIYVALAVMASVLSETSVPRRAYEMVLAPVQRHLEGLVHFAPDEQIPPRPQGAAAAGNGVTTNQQAVIRDDRGANWMAGVHHSLRRVERSAALFIASLVPGVGERHIEVRNAAEAARNAELARQEEERRQQEEANAAATAEEQSQPEANDTAPLSDGLNNAAAINERQSTIPQEA
ncbi:uncharacterized protein BJX67DRAFT_340850 [Aspergillus lucknowensis]|uniref:Ubiquitin-like domain-containing protein n=1 Tax=Aspergillus lucknowensis TaxID=176173 RepID=A0ABR4M5K0_9EURO